MTAGKLFRKTMPFIWAKILLGGIAAIVAILLLAAFAGIGWLFGEIGLAIAVIAWILAVRVIWYFIMHGFGYLIKAGHVAVIAEACQTGSVPAGQVGYGKAMVKKRFITAAVYFAVDKLISGAVKEIQKNIGRLGDRLDFIPGMEAVTGMAQFFVKISLGYIDECCLGWTFYNKEQGAFKSAADGVVLYTQNWKSLLKNAAWTMIKVIVLTVLIALMIFIPVGIVFKLMGWHPLIALLLAIAIAWVVKFAAMDSYIMVRMMASYMDVAPVTTIRFDLYGTLCSISAKFKELYSKGQEEDPGHAAPQTGRYTASQAGGYTAPQANRYIGSQTGRQFTGGNHGAPDAPGWPVFCGQCGAGNDSRSKFCGACGAKL